MRNEGDRWRRTRSSATARGTTTSLARTAAPARICAGAASLYVIVVCKRALRRQKCRRKARNAAPGGADVFLTGYTASPSSRPPAVCRHPRRPRRYRSETPLSLPERYHLIQRSSLRARTRRPGPRTSPRRGRTRSSASEEPSIAALSAHLPFLDIERVRLCSRTTSTPATGRAAAVGVHDGASWPQRGARPRGTRSRARPWGWPRWPTRSAWSRTGRRPATGRPSRRTGA